MLWGAILSILFLLSFLLLMKRNSFFRCGGLSLKWIYSAFFLKLLGGIMLFLLYSYYYNDRENSDIFKYYDDAVSIYNSPELKLSTFSDLFCEDSERSESYTKLIANTQHWDRGDQLLPNDNRMMIRLNLLLMFLSNDFYLFHLLIFSSLSFLGSIALFHFFNALIDLPSKILWIIIFLPPSILLWTSGILKESLLLLFLGGFLYCLEKVTFQGKIKYGLLSLVLLFFLLGIKSYLLICLIPSLFNQKIGLKWSLISSLSLLAAFILLIKDSFISEFNRVQTNFIELADQSAAGSRFEISETNSLMELLMNAPVALYNVWIRPIIPLRMGPLDLLNSLESLLYVLLLASGLILYNDDWRKKKSSMLISFSLLFLLLASVLIGSSIPIMGAIVRYRSPLILFYLVAVFTFVDWKKLSSKFNL